MCYMLLLLVLIVLLLYLFDLSERRYFPPLDLLRDAAGCHGLSSRLLLQVAAAAGVINNCASVLLFQGGVEHLSNWISTATHLTVLIKYIL